MSKPNQTQKTIKKLFEQKRELEEKLGSLPGQLVEARVRIEEREEQVNALRSKVRLLCGELRKHEDTLASIVNGKEAAEDKLKRETSFGKAAVDKVSVLREKLHAAEDTVAAFKTALSAAQAERDEYKALAEANEVKKLRRRLQEVKEEAAAQLRKERADLNVKINRANYIATLAYTTRVAMKNDVIMLDKLLQGLAKELTGLGAPKAKIESWAKQIKDAVEQANKTGALVDAQLAEGKAMELLEGVPETPVTPTEAPVPQGG